LPKNNPPTNKATINVPTANFGKNFLAFLTVKLEGVWIIGFSLGGSFIGGTGGGTSGGAGGGVIEGCRPGLSID